MFAIQQISTGKFMPTYRGGQRRGTTFIEPKDFSSIPRLFKRKQDADGVLKQWLEGQLHPKYSADPIFSDNVEFVGMEAVHQPNRDPTDYLVLEVEVVVKQGVLL